MNDLLAECVLLRKCLFKMPQSNAACRPLPLFRHTSWMKNPDANRWQRTELIIPVFGYCDIALPGTPGLWQARRNFGDQGFVSFSGSNKQRFVCERIQFQNAYNVLLDAAEIIERRKPGSRLARVTEEWTFFGSLKSRMGFFETEEWFLMRAQKILRSRLLWNELEISFRCPNGQMTRPETLGGEEFIHRNEIENGCGQGEKKLFSSITFRTDSRSNASASCGIFIVGRVPEWEWIHSGC